ncbi:small acid-soluble spore protein SspI [Cohnella suwonensis]|uniref:Small, acid-soluble spore protein I n=1 Tax=Cohnella suwonensis TaxID=696072 RepID=A0ABW0LVS1_9BACL
MELTLRQAIVQNIRGKDAGELAAIVDDAIDGEDMALPGLGVVFEMIWKGSTDAARSKMMSVLHKKLNPAVPSKAPKKT